MSKRPALVGELKKEVVRKPASIALDRLVQTEGLSAVKPGKVGVENDPLLPDQADDGRGILHGESAIRLGHNAIRIHHSAAMLENASGRATEFGSTGFSPGRPAHRGQQHPVENMTFSRTDPFHDLLAGAAGEALGLRTN